MNRGREFVLLAIAGLTALAARAIAWSAGLETGWPVIGLAIVSIGTSYARLRQNGWRYSPGLPIRLLPAVPIIGAIALGRWSEAALVAFLFDLAGWIGAIARDRARGVIEDLQAQINVQRTVDRQARFYALIVVLLAILVAMVPPFFLGGRMAWLYRAFVMLVLASPCALLLSVSITIKSAMTRVAERGIHIKDMAALETGSAIRAVILLKTGMLTMGHPVVTDFIPLVQTPQPDHLLQLATSLETRSAHPVAAAIAAYAKEVGVVSLLFVSEFESLAGRGVRGIIDGQAYYIGHQRLCEEVGICNAHLKQMLNELQKQAKTALVLGSEKEALAIIGVEDRIKASSKHAVLDLHALKVDPVLLSGDNQLTATLVSFRSGTANIIRGKLLPEEKLAVIDEMLDRFGAIGVVGRDQRDVSAMMRATMGFAIGPVERPVKDAAQVEVLADDLGKLPFFLALCRRMMQLLKWNVVLFLGLNGLLLALALTGRLTLWMAALGYLAIGLLLSANGLQLLQYKGIHYAPPKRAVETQPACYGSGDT